MLDLRIIQDDPDQLTDMLKRRHVTGFDSKSLSTLIQKTKDTQSQLNEAQSERNSASKAIGQLIGQGKQDEAEKKKMDVKEINERIEKLDTAYDSLQTELRDLISGLPNWVAADVPPGKDENDNKTLSEVGERRAFSFQPKTHWEIGEGLGALDFERGVKLAGSRYYTYRGLLAKLERALIQYMLDIHTAKHGYEEVFVPMLINDDGMFTTGQFPKFRGEYYTLERDGLSLIPTAEVPLVNLYRDEIIAEDDLPIAMTAATSCFRREAGAAGKDTRGLVRVHQFQKVELVQLVHPDQSEHLHDRMLEHAETILKGLGIPYRVLLLCSGDMGATAVKTYDLEVWMPGLDRWLEISSVSNCRDYQARRGMIRYKGTDKKAKTQFVHTLNGSGVAAGRCMIAIMENFQKEDGSFDVPEALQPYMNRGA